MLKHLFILAVLIVLFISSISSVLASPTSKIEQQVNIINQEYSTTNATAAPSDNSLGLIQWQADEYNHETVYFEAVIYCSSCSGGNAQVDATLYTDSGAAVTGGTISTTSSSYTRVRSADITSNLTNNEEYTIRLARDATAGTAYIQAARLIIVQDGVQVSDTLTQIELGNNDTTVNTSYELMSGPPIYLWDEDVHTDVQNVYFEATLQGSDATAVSYASLSLSSTCASTVSGSEVSITGTTWGRDRSSDISSNLTDNTDYFVCVKTTSADTGAISNAKLIIEQSNADGIDIIELVHQHINTVATDTDGTYTSQNFLNQLDPANFTADIVTYFFESTINTTAATAYSILYNNSDTATITGSEVTTSNTGYTRVRSQDITDNMPSGTKTFDTQLKNSTNTTSASSSWIIINVDDVLDADLSFALAGTSADQVFNDITTSVATNYNELDFAHLTFNQPKYATHKLDASTNAPSGYTVSVKLQSFMQGLYPANDIDGFIAPWTAPTTWTQPTGTSTSVNTGWLGANTTDTRVPNWGSSSEKFGVVNSSYHTVMQSTSADSGTTAYVTYAIEVNILQPADLYSGVIVYNILPVY